MPEVGAVDESGTLENPAEIVGELFLSSDVIKSGDFNPEGHVILVVPESSEHLISDGENGTSYVIPTSEDAEGCDVLNDVDPNRLRETIKSNFLVITKLLPSKSPPPLVPIASSKLTGEVVKIEEPLDEPVLQKISLTSRPSLPKTPTKTRQLRSPRSPGVKNHTVKQEGPEIFGKMFPASYNEVMYKQIREIIYFKCGKDASEETEVPEGINCPHCRKKPLTLALLKEHLANCHTYSSTKRKNESPASRNIIKKTLFRCQYCDEAFLSHAHRDSHECTLSAKPLEHVKDATTVTIITCDICRQDFGSPSELKSHQNLDHKEELMKRSSLAEHSRPVPETNTASEPVDVSSKTYIVCSFCDKRVSSSLREEHLKKHRGQGARVARKCLKCSKMAASNADNTCALCSSDVDTSGQESSAICPTCDLEIDSASFHDHVLSHRDALITDDPDNKTAIRIVVCSSCRGEFEVPVRSNTTGTEKCRKCRVS